MADETPPPQANPPEAVPDPDASGLTASDSPLPPEPVPAPEPVAVESPAETAPDGAVTAAAEAPETNLIAQAELDALVMAGPDAPAGPSTPVSAASPEVNQTATRAEEPAVFGARIRSTTSDGAIPAPVPELSVVGGKSATSQIDLLDDVELNVKVELGRTQMYIEDILRLGEGAVIELDKLAGDPVDVFVNERLVARGEVLVLNESFCVRINDIVNPAAELEDDR